ncbi:hypothetical protein [Burkholderia cenocepacia]|uniref:hypothetical protein n=1 Tax=Burkholderia cenocepacia TaxID=95486 RepID=UPI002AB28CFD|nr:hypothetical protein [Burkholderia cenocepacia]
MELNIAFSCPCGAFVNQNLHVDMQESSTDTASDRDEELYASVQCDGCGKDFEAQIFAATICEPSTPALLIRRAGRFGYRYTFQTDGQLAQKLAG